MNKNKYNKLVPKLRFPEFENDGKWEFEKLEPYIDLFSGIALKSEELSDDESGIPILRGINITEGYIRHSKDIDKYFLGELDNLKKYLIKENDIVIGMDGSKVGKNVALVTKEDKDSILIQRVARIRTNQKSDIKYIYQYFISDKFKNYVNTVNTSSGIPHISAQQIKNFEIGVPPKLKEQQKIASCLSSLDEVITAENQKLDILQDHKKGLLQNLLPQEGETVPKFRFKEFENIGDWVFDTFSEYIKLYRGSSPRPIQNYFTTDESGVNWIKIGDTKNADSFTINQVEERITPEGAEKSRKVNVGELILANSMSFGKTYQLAIEGYIYDGWFVLREFEKHFDKQFLIQLLNSEYMQRQYKKLSAGGIVQNISSDIVYNTVLPHTSVNEQKRIAFCLSSLDEIISAQRQKVDTLKLHKKGLLQGLFPNISNEV